MVPLKLINSVLIMTSLLQVTVDIFASFTIIVGIFFPSVTGRSFFELLLLNQKHRDLFVRLFFWQRYKPPKSNFWWLYLYQSKYRPYLFINFYPLYLSTLPIFIPIIYLSIYLSIYIYIGTVYESLLFGSAFSLFRNEHISFSIRRKEYMYNVRVNTYKLQMYSSQ